jgi:hypothetical protein
MRHRMWSGLKRVILEQDWVLVTPNSDDFRGPRHAPGTKGQYADVPLHAGIVCLNGPVGMDLDWHRRLFGEVLDELDGSGDLTNHVLEVTLDDDKAAIDLIRYEMPSPEDPYWQPSCNDKQITASYLDAKI